MRGFRSKFPKLILYLAKAFVSLATSFFLHRVYILLIRLPILPFFLVHATHGRRSHKCSCTASNAGQTWDDHRCTQIIYYIKTTKFSSKYTNLFFFSSSFFLLSSSFPHSSSSYSVPYLLDY